MRVIAEGNSPAKWSKRFVCTECSAVLEVDEPDLHVVNTAVAYAGETWDPRLRFTCEICHSVNDVTGQVPSGIQGKLFGEAFSKNSARS